MSTSRLRFATVLSLAIALAGCDGTTDPDAGPDPDAGTMVDAGATDAGDVDAGRAPLVVPDTYSFDSRFEEGSSSVSHGGQTTRNVLMNDITDYAASLTGQVEANTGVFEDVDDGEVISAMEYFFSIDGADRADDPIRLETTPAALQETYGDLGGANLLAKLAGNDTSTDHEDWSTAFTGWSDASFATAGGGIDSPTNLVMAIFHNLEDNAQAYDTDPASRQSPVDTPQNLPVHVQENGVDLAQLLGAFLHGGIAFSQASDDYADDDVEDKGLLGDNVEADGTYTALEHAWDEAFGYYGASFDADAFTPAQIAGGELARDLDSDSRIDLVNEYNFTFAAAAARRDADANTATSYSEDIFEAFRTGRAIISRADGALSEQDLADLQAQRDIAISAWESAGAATVVAHLNRVLQVMADYGTSDFDHSRFLELANEWAQMKGLALMFQFNPRSAVSDSDFTMLHTLLGDAPVLPAAGDTDVEAYRTDLRAARTLLGTAFGLASGNLGDDNGEGGW